ncbi:MAG: hypothetical protein ACM3VT_09670 [Solirubrobacterales bacterium]
MTAFIPTAILALSLAAYGGGWGGSTGTAAESYSANEAPALLRVLEARSRGDNPQERILRTAFVVPGPELGSEAISQITEDLAVMCRIFDKATIWAAKADSGNVPLDISGVELSSYGILTQSLYLDGYGAIFFLPVSFALAPSGQEQTPLKTESAADPLWSQTANELHGVPTDSDRMPRQQYDAQKVENLKAALIGTLRYAANLRMHRAEDVITIVVASRGRQGSINEMLGEVYGSDIYGATRGGGRVVDPTSEPPAVLILRTTRTDVAALAKGALSQEQFAGKVQILGSWGASGPAEAGLRRYGRRGGGTMGGGGGYGGGMSLPSQKR